MSVSDRSRIRDTIASVRTESAGSSSRGAVAARSSFGTHIVRLPNQICGSARLHRRSGSGRAAAPPSVVLGGPQDPDERLDVDHVARTPVGEVVAQHLREARAGSAYVLPARCGSVAEVEPVRRRGAPGHDRLQHQVHAWPGDERERGEHRPGQDPRLRPGQVAPRRRASGRSARRRARAVQEVVETSRRTASLQRATGSASRIAIFSNENSRLVDASMRTMRRAMSSWSPGAERRRVRAPVRARRRTGGGPPTSAVARAPGSRRRGSRPDRTRGSGAALLPPGGRRRDIVAPVSARRPPRRSPASTGRRDRARRRPGSPRSRYRRPFRRCPAGHRSPRPVSRRSRSLASQQRGELVAELVGDVVHLAARSPRRVSTSNTARALRSASSTDVAVRSATRATNSIGRIVQGRAAHRHRARGPNFGELGEQVAGLVGRHALG